MILLFALVTSAHAVGPVITGERNVEKPASDKSQYTLFRPTPGELMRELSTDRPDKTESAYTIDAGHFQLEMDVLSYSYERHNPARDSTRTETVSIAPINFKVGLLNDVDFQLIVQSYMSIRTHDLASGLVRENRGFGDVSPRVKLNLWGNDGGRTALAVMPYLKLPTNQDHLGNNAVEGGIIFPLAVELPYGWGMGLMTQYDLNRDSAGSGHHAEFINSITFSHDMVRQLAGYVEFFSTVSREANAPWVGTFDVGFTYGLTKDIQLDAGINLGVTRSAEDLNPFLGISFRY